jgi:hypothetical protein
VDIVETGHASTNEGVKKQERAKAQADKAFAVDVPVSVVIVSGAVIAIIWLDQKVGREQDGLKR